MQFVVGSVAGTHGGIRIRPGCGDTAQRLGRKMERGTWDCEIIRNRQAGPERVDAFQLLNRTDGRGRAECEQLRGKRQGNGCVGMVASFCVAPNVDVVQGEEKLCLNDVQHTSRVGAI